MPWPGWQVQWRRWVLLWRGRDPAAFRALWEALEASDIFFERTHARGFEAAPPAYRSAPWFSLPVFHIRVRAEDASRARQILRVILQASSPV